MGRLSRQAQHNHKGPYERETGGELTEEDMTWLAGKEEARVMAQRM